MLFGASCGDVLKKAVFRDESCFFCMLNKAGQRKKIRGSLKK